MRRRVLLVMAAVACGGIGLGFWLGGQASLPAVPSPLRTTLAKTPPSAVPTTGGSDHSMMSGSLDDPFELARRADPESIIELVERLTREVQPTERDRLRRALSLISQPRSVECLLDCLVVSADADVVQATQLALARMATPAITRQLAQAHGQAASEEAAKRIAKAVEWTHSPLCLPVLAELVNLPGFPLDEGLGRAALHAISALGTPYAVTILATRIEHATDEDAALLCKALSQIGGGLTEHELMAVAQRLRPETSRLETRIAAIKALGNYPLSLTRPALNLLSADADPQVAANARIVLEKAGQRD